MRARRSVRCTALGAVVLVSALACGVRPEDSPRVLDSADAVPRLPVPTVSQQPGTPTACPPAPSAPTAPTATPAPGPTPSPVPTPSPAPTPSPGC